MIERVPEAPKPSSLDVREPPETGSLTGVRLLGTRPCPGCGAIVSAHMSVCPECGESLQRRLRKLRCARCGGQAPSELVICPHCGRELHPAPPRWLAWGAPVFLAGLLLVVLALQWDSGNPVVWLREQVTRGFTVVGSRIEPEVVIVVTPVAAAVQMPAEGVAATSSGEGAAQVPAAAESGETGLAAGAALSATEPLSLPTPTATQEPPTATAMPTATPPPTVPPTATAAPTVAAEPVFVTYTVKTGDTLVTIAARQGVDVDELMEANDISAREVFVIQPGQVLVIPVEATPTPLPTPTAAATAIPTKPAAQPLPTPAPNASATPTGLRLAAPQLQSPADGATIDCAEPGTLVWQRVPLLRDSDRYVVHLGFVSGRSATGQEQVTWIATPSRPATQTSWELDESLCGLAPQQTGRQWRWWVEVVAESGGKQAPVSPPSEIWGFVWN